MRILALFVRALLIATTCTFFTGCGSTESTDLAPSPGLESLSFGSPQTIDLLTWNIETFPKDEQRSPGYVVDILSVLQPDIVAVQEIWSLAHLIALPRSQVQKTLGLPSSTAGIRSP